MADNENQSSPPQPKAPDNFREEKKRGRFLARFQDGRFAPHDLNDRIRSEISYALFDNDISGYIPNKYGGRKPKSRQNVVGQPLGTDSSASPNAQPPTGGVVPAVNDQPQNVESKTLLGAIQKLNQSLISGLDNLNNSFRSLTTDNKRLLRTTQTSASSLDEVSSEVNHSNVILSDIATSLDQAKIKQPTTSEKQLIPSSNNSKNNVEQPDLLDKIVDTVTSGGAAAVGGGAAAGGLLKKFGSKALSGLGKLAGKAAGPLALYSAGNYALNTIEEKLFGWTDEQKKKDEQVIKEKADQWWKSSDKLSKTFGMSAQAKESDAKELVSTEQKKKDEPAIKEKADQWWKSSDKLSKTFGMSTQANESDAKELLSAKQKQLETRSPVASIDIEGRTVILKGDIIKFVANNIDFGDQRRSITTASLGTPQVGGDWPPPPPPADGSQPATPDAPGGAPADPAMPQRPPITTAPGTQAPIVLPAASGQGGGGGRPTPDQPLGGRPDVPRQIPGLSGGSGGSRRSSHYSIFDQKAKKIMTDLMHDFNLSKEDAAAVVGNLGHESGGFKLMQEQSPTSGRGGWGWAQWTGSRRVAFENYVKENNLDPSSDQANYGFLKKELSGEYSSALDGVRGASTLEDKMTAFEHKFEKSGDYDQRTGRILKPKNVQSRIDYTRRAAGLYDGTVAPENNNGGGNQNLAAKIKQVAPHLSNEECVTLAKSIANDNRSVKEWRRGDSAVSGDLKSGTPIATFMDRQGNQSDKYDGGVGVGIRGNHTTHAAVFDSYKRDKDGKIIGMNVWEQFAGSHGPRQKTYNVGGGFGTRNASNYFTIKDKQGQQIGGSVDFADESSKREQKAQELSQRSEQSSVRRERPPPAPVITQSQPQSAPQRSEEPRAQNVKAGEPDHNIDNRHKFSDYYNV